MCCLPLCMGVLCTFTILVFLVLSTAVTKRKFVSACPCNLLNEVSQTTCLIQTSNFDSKGHEYPTFIL